MTLLEDPPVIAEPSATRAEAITAEPSAWRLALRLARRETRRRPGRTVLASLLIAVPVMAMTVGSVFARSESGSWSAQFERRFGDADIAVDRSSFTFASEDASPVALPNGTEVTEYLWVNTTVTTANLNRPFTYATITDIDLGDPTMGAPLEVVEGSNPGVGEILLPAEIAKALDVRVGDDVTFERPSGTWTVSGISRVRDSYYNDAIVIPGFDRERVADDYEQMVTLYDLPASVSQTDTQQLAAELGGVTSAVDPYGFSFPGGDVGRGVAWGWVAGALALVAVGIIVAAAFATSARRQLVTIGQLVANGATESTVRRTLALQGTWTGLSGALVGIAGGIASLPVVTPVIERQILLHDAASFRFSAFDFVVIALTATLAGTVAAAVPARSASRIPVMSALAGRRPLGALPRWLVPTGLLLLAGGLGLVAVASLGINGSRSTGTGDDVWALLIVLGVVGVVFGMCCATPLVIEGIGRLGRRASLSWRLALRGLGRSRTRSSAVVAAIAVAVGGSVAAGSIVEAAMRENLSWLPTLPADSIVFESHYNQEAEYETDAGSPMIDLDALPATSLPDDVRDQVLAIVPGATITPMRTATIDPRPFNTETGDAAWPEPQGPHIADRELIDVIGLSASDIDLLEESGSLQPMSRWQLANPQEDGTWTPRYDGPNGSFDFVATPGTDPYGYEIGGWGRPLITEAYARELGFDIVERGALVQAPQALTEGQRNQLAELQAIVSGPQLDAFVESGDQPRSALIDASAGSDQWSLVFDEPRYRLVDDSDLWIARLVVVAAAVLFSLLVVAIGLSLAAAESRDERNVLAVVGATPASMRRQASARAAVMAASGIAVGIPTGFLPAWVLYSVLNPDGSGFSESLRFPWLIVVGLLAVVPALVAGVAWIGSGLGQRFRPASPTRRD